VPDRPRVAFTSRVISRGGSAGLGTPVAANVDKPQSEYNGKTYDFCSASCRATFEGNAPAYAAK
jgi:YHS domain-containing protein